MKAIVLAAGHGSRLMPLTRKIPKAMVKLFGETLLQHQINILTKCGINEIIVVVGHYGNTVLGENLKIIENKFFNSTNMVSSLFCASDEFDGKKDIVVTYGDIVFEKRVLQALLSCEAPVAISADLNWKKYWELRLENPLSDAETFKLDSLGNVKELGKKPQGFNEIEAQYMGLIKIDSECQKPLIKYYKSLSQEIKYDGQEFKNMYMTSFLQNLIDDGWEIKPAFTRGGWLEVDTLDDFELYNNLDRQNKLSPFFII